MSTYGEDKNVVEKYPTLNVHLFVSHKSEVFSLYSLIFFLFITYPSTLRILLELQENNLRIEKRKRTECTPFNLDNKEKWKF